MNLLSDPSKWREYGQDPPPLSWSPDTQSYEIVVANPLGNGQHLLLESVAAAAGDTLEFGYSIGDSFYTEPDAPGDYVLRLMDSTDYVELWSVSMSDAPVSGNISFPCAEGHSYFFEVFREGGFTFSLYDLNVTLSPVMPVPPDPPGGGCEEIGRVTRAFVSAHNRYRVHVGQVRRHERRCVVANFNGAIPASMSIVSVRWDCANPWVARMSAPAINGREAQVTVDFQAGGFAALRATVTLDNGEIYNQAFEFTVRDVPGFVESGPIGAGPFSVTASTDP